MRKTISILLTAVMIFGICLMNSCSDDRTNSDGKPQVLATNFAMYDIARGIAGDTAGVSMLLPPETEAHEYELTLSDAGKIDVADLFVCVGGESEDWVFDLMDSMREEERPRTVYAIDAAQTADEALVSAIEREEGGEETEPDEHVWTSFENIRRIADAVAENLSLVLPDKADVIAGNLAAYKAEADRLEAEYRERLANRARNTIVVADRFPFLYLTEEFGLEHIAAFTGCSSNVEASLATISALISEVRRVGAPAVFVIEFSDQKCAEAVAKETGCKIMTLNSAHNVSKEQYQNGVTLFELMLENLDALEAALS